MRSLTTKMVALMVVVLMMAALLHKHQEEAKEEEDELPPEAEVQKEEAALRQGLLPRLQQAQALQRRLNLLQKLSRPNAGVAHSASCISTEMVLNPIQTLPCEVVRIRVSMF